MTRLVGFLKVYQELEKKNLDRCFEQMRKYTDHIVVYDDGSNDGTQEALRQWSTIHSLTILRSEKNHFKGELQAKQEMLEACRKAEADWVIWLDADEVLNREGVERMRKWLLSVPPEVDGFLMRNVNLWRSESFERFDNQYGDGWFMRLWRMKPDLKFNVIEGLHHPQYPQGITNHRVAPFKVINFGFSTMEYISYKYINYQNQGQSGWALERLIDENGIMFNPVSAKDFPDGITPRPQPPLPSPSKEQWEECMKYVRSELGWTLSTKKE